MLNYLSFTYKRLIPSKGILYVGLFLCGLVLFFISPQGAAGQTYNVYHYNSDNGLHNELIKGIEMDTTGFVWLATDDGIIRFDGISFYLINKNLPSNKVKDIRLYDNQIYASTDLGLVKVNQMIYDPTVETVLQGSVRKTDSLLWYPKQLFIDNEDALWVSTNHTLHRIFYDSDKHQIYEFEEKERPDSFHRSLSMFQIKGETYAFSQPGHLFKLNQSTNEFEQQLLPIEHQVFAVDVLTEEKVLVATVDGLYQLSFESDKILTKKVSPLFISSFAQLDEKNWVIGSWNKGLYTLSFDETTEDYTIERLYVMEEANINSLMVDPDKNIWVGSDHGLYLLKPHLFNKVPLGHAAATLVNGKYLEGPDRVFYSEASHILSKNPYNENEAPKVVFTNPSANDIVAYTISGKYIWYADYAGHLYRFDGTKHEMIQFEERKDVTHLFLDKQNRIWFGRNGIKKVFLIPDPSKKEIIELDSTAGVNSSITTFFQNDNGKIYAAGDGDKAYFYQIDTFNNKFINLSRPFSASHNIAMSVNQIAFDSNNTPYLATLFGILRVEADSAYSILDNEIDYTFVKSIVIDKNDVMWFTTSRGVHKFDGDNHNVLDNRDGLPTRVTDTRALVLSPNNELWVGVLNGLCYSDVKNDFKKTRAPLVKRYINSSTIEDGPSAKALHIDQTDMVQGRAAYFSVMCPQFPGYSVQYEYALIRPQDQELANSSNTVNAAWQSLALDDFVNIDFKQVGQYTLLLRAKQKGNYTWSDASSYRFKSFIPWYRAWWAIVLYIMVASVLLRYLFMFWSRKLKQQNQELERRVSIRTNELKEQKEALEQSNTQLAIANEEAQKASKAKSRFLSIISHELKTPLNAINGAAYLIENKLHKAKIDDDNMRTLHFATDMLTTLINSLIDFSSIEKGDLKLKNRRISLYEICQFIKDIYESGAKEKGLDFTLIYDQSIPSVLKGDDIRISQIMNNLLDNAIKYTFEGDIKLSVRLVEKSLTESKVRFSVIDTGIGISKKKLKSILEEFSQGDDDNTTRTFGGIGIGLSVSQKLLKLMDSKFEINSTLGIGTSVSFDVSFTHADVPEENNQEELDFEQFKASGVKVLLVEDNFINAKITSRYLEAWECDFDIATDGAIGFNKCKDKIYDVILMDLQMPNMDGYESAHKIRTEVDSINKQSPIVAVTAEDINDIEDRVKNAGINTIIPKPFNPVLLFETIQSCVDKEKNTTTRA